jgi:hypothetical protein
MKQRSVTLKRLTNHPVRFAATVHLLTVVLICLMVIERLIHV